MARRYPGGVRRHPQDRGIREQPAALRQAFPTRRRWCSMALCGNRYQAAQFRKKNSG
ncbi:MAG: CGNR zinc finger domain-containing protein [Spongiibacteraceae bacterium]